MNPLTHVGQTAHPEASAPQQQQPDTRQHGAEEQQQRQRQQGDPGDTSPSEIDPGAAEVQARDGK